MNVAQRLRSLDAEGMDNSLARRLAGDIDRECGDVVLQTTRAAGPALIVAGDARVGVEHRTKAVSLRRERIIRLPFVLEQHLTRLGHSGIYRLRWGLLPQKQASDGGYKGQDDNQEIPDAIGPI